MEEQERIGIVRGAYLHDRIYFDLRRRHQASRDLANGRCFEHCGSGPAGAALEIGDELGPSSESSPIGAVVVERYRVGFAVALSTAGAAPSANPPLIAR
jgi:hypothetical protein